MSRARFLALLSVATGFLMVVAAALWMREVEEAGYFRAQAEIALALEQRLVASGGCQ